MPLINCYIFVVFSIEGIRIDCSRNCATAVGRGGNCFRLNVAKGQFNVRHKNQMSAVAQLIKPLLS